MKRGTLLPKVSQQWLLQQALMAAKKRKPLSPKDREPGTGTNEGGPQVQTDYPANAWPEDGDHG